MKLWLIAVVVAVLGWGTLAQAQGYRLAFRHTAGTTRTYANTIKVSGNVDAMGLAVPITGTVTFTLTEQVTAVNPDGSANITTQLTNGNAQLTITGLPGQEEPQTISQVIPPVTLTYTRTPQGAVRNLTTSGMATSLPGLPVELLNNLQTPGQILTFPDRTLQIGDTWASDLQAEVAPGQPISITATNQLAGIEQVAGKDYLRVMTAATANVPGVVISTDQIPGQPATQLKMSLKLTMNAITLFDATAGEVFRTTFTGDAQTTVVPVDGSPAMAITANLRLEGTMQKQ